MLMMTTRRTAALLLPLLLLILTTTAAAACAGNTPPPTAAPPPATPADALPTPGDPTSGIIASEGAIPTPTTDAIPTPGDSPWGIMVSEGGIRTPTTDAIPTPSPTATPPPPTSTPRPTATPTPRPTPTPVPTSTPAPTDTPLPNIPLVQIGSALYQVDLATTQETITRGLSGRPSLDVERAMLFVYESDAPRAFWMPDMHFPLDMVWITSDCAVAAVTADVPHPAPETPRSELPVYPSQVPVRFVLEINAGQAAQHGIAPGTPVEFAGAIANRWGC